VSLPIFVCRNERERLEKKLSEIRSQKQSLKDQKSILEDEAIVHEKEIEELEKNLEELKSSSNIEQENIKEEIKAMEVSISLVAEKEKKLDEDWKIEQETHE